jgi:diguanylate cyclase (GGDEF)-like protein/PAS domain S-box-containing protein
MNSVLAAAGATGPGTGPFRGGVLARVRGLRQRYWANGGWLGISIALGSALMIGFTWLVALERVAYEYADTAAHANRENSNLAVALDAHIARTLKSVDQSLRLIVREYGEQGTRLDLAGLVRDGSVDGSILHNVGVSDERGNIVLNSVAFQATNATDREFFRVHRDRNDVGMFLGEPLFGRVTRQWALHASRRIDKPDGSFGGIAVAALDPHYFTALYQQAQLGKQDAIMIVGLDGVTRARRVGDEQSFGQDMTGSTLLAEQARRPIGSFVSNGTREGVPRFNSYRTLKDFDLVVAVGTSIAETMAEFRQRERAYYLGSALASAIIALFSTLLIVVLSRQRRAAAALARAAESLESAQRIGRVGDWSVDLKTRQLAWSRQVYRMFGRDPALGPPTLEEFMALVAPESLPGLQEHTRLAIETGNPQQYDAWFRLAEGRSACHRTRMEIERNPAGEPARLVGTAHDVTESRRAEAALADESARRRIMFDQSPDGIVIFDPETARFVEFNEAAHRQLGYTREEFALLSIPDVEARETPEQTRAAIAGMMRTGAVDFETRHRTKQGDIRDVHVKAQVINVFGRPVYYSVWRDITDRNISLQRIETLNRLYITLSGVNEAVIRSGSRKELCERICRVASGGGGWAGAWIGFLEPATRRIVPEAWSESMAPYISGVRVSVDADVPEGRGPTSIAARAGKPYFCNDVYTDPATRPWRGFVEKFGMGSAAAVPLSVDNAFVGVINLYARQKDFYTPEVQALLNDLAANVSFGLDTLIVSVNPAFCAITGYRHEEILGRTPKFLQSGRHDAAFYSAMWREIEQAGHWRGEIWDRRKNGEIYPELLSISVVKDAAGTTTHYVGVCTDISSLKQYEARLQHQAHHDALTGLPNRALFQDRFRETLGRARRHRSEAAVLVLDLDRFKNINDSLGHALGDLLLQAVAQRLTASVREVDTVARFGGDEFAVLLDTMENGQKAGHVAQKLVDALAHPFQLGGHELYISASIGIGCYPQDGTDAEVLFKNADTAMYRAKAEGRNNYQYFSAEMNARALENLQMSNHLRQALERDEFQLHYQPHVELQSGRVSGAEALIRWRHPALGMIPPAKFIPLAEETGLIEPIGEWVLKAACRQMRAWQDAGLPLQRIAVNLSARQFRHPELVRRIAGILEETRLPARHLELEVTESMVMQNPENAAAVLSELRAMGISIAVDDFGTGYSSLSYLKRFPIHFLKIDRSFVSGIPQDADDAAITKGIIALARSLNLKLIAEGVETAEQREFLKRSGCDEGQGYLFSKPVPAADIERLLRSPAAHASADLAPA